MDKTSPSDGPTSMQQAKAVQVGSGIAIGQTKDRQKTEMKYDSTGMFHWCPAQNLDDCILVVNIYSGTSLL